VDWRFSKRFILYRFNKLLFLISARKFDRKCLRNSVFISSEPCVTEITLRYIFRRQINIQRGHFLLCDIMPRWSQSFLFLYFRLLLHHFMPTESSFLGPVHHGRLINYIPAIFWNPSHFIPSSHNFSSQNLQIWVLLAGSISHFLLNIFDCRIAIPLLEIRFIKLIFFCFAGIFVLYCFCDEFCRGYAKTAPLAVPVNMVGFDWGLGLIQGWFHPSFRLSRLFQCTFQSILHAFFLHRIYF
jgi:hypothetical protein